MKKSILLVLFCLLFSNLFSGEVIQMPSNSVDKWYSTGVFYELFVRSFKDSNGDKYGDFQGVTQKIDYLEKLGITAIWFMPINDSAEHTNNYDPTNFMDVDPTYGTLDDFKNLINQLHAKNIKVIIDLVINHTSDQHPFFIDATKDKKSKYRNWYLWSETNINETNKKKVWHETPTGWYFGKFVNSKPDLNYDNPEVLAYMKNVMRFWLDAGVDGFRFDAVADVTESDEQNFQIFRDFRKVIHEEKYNSKDIFLIGESSSQPYTKYLGTGKDMFHAVFNFQSNRKVLNLVKEETPYTTKGLFLIEEDLVKRYAKDLKNTEGGFYGTLLTNHDSFSAEDNKKLKRPFTFFEQNVEKTKLAGSLYLTFPGIPFVYYGEEIGMDTFTASKSDKWLRSCMQWDDSKNSGFSPADKLWNMLNENYPLYNVSKQNADEQSILNHYRSIISIRTQNKALSLGSFESINVKSKNKPQIAVYVREYQGNKVMVIHNFSGKKETIDLDVAGSTLENKEVAFIPLLGKTAKITNKKNMIKISNVNPYSSVILQF